MVAKKETRAGPIKCGFRPRGKPHPPWIQTMSVVRQLWVLEKLKNIHGGRKEGRGKGVTRSGAGQQTENQQPGVLWANLEQKLKLTKK